MFIQTLVRYCIWAIRHENKVHYFYYYYSNGSDSSDCKFGAWWQNWEPVQLAIQVILGIFWSFSLKAHNNYPIYHIGADFFRLNSPSIIANSLHENVLCGQFYNFLFKGGTCFDCPTYSREWAQFVSQNCEKPQNYRFK